MAEHNLSKEVKWRGSTYVLETVENGEVTWYNPVSTFRGKCSEAGWKSGNQYSDEI